MSKDGVSSDGHVEGDSSAECTDCYWGPERYRNAKQARSAARYHAVSTGHRSVAVIVRQLFYKKAEEV